MYILITGGLGYIGSHVANALFVCGYTNLIILDNASSGIMDNHKHGVLVQGDIRNRDQLEDVFRRYDIECVFHIAGKAFVKESYEFPDEYYDTNVVGTLHILQLMHKYGVHNIVFSSSCSVYGNAVQFPITEHTPLSPLSPYAHTKKIAEDLIRAFSLNFGMRYVILRYFNVAGNDAECRVSDVPNNRARIIPSIINAMTHDLPIYVNGDTYNTTD